MKNAILERWRAIVARCPGAVAVCAPDGRAARSFAEIDAEADEIAASLGDAAAGAVASVQSPNSPAWPALMLGVWKAGACALLVDHSASVSARGDAERICGTQWRLDGTGVLELGYPAADFGSAAPDLIKLTSGTSGAPRAILFTAAQLAADCDNICETMGIGDGDLNYGVATFSHSYGFSNLITPLLCRGIPLVAAQDALPRAVLAGMAATGATVLPAVPAVFHALGGLEGNMPGLRLCISAGAPLRAEAARRFRQRFGRKVHTFYGSSECGGIAYDASEEDVEDGEVGAALSGVEIEPRGGGEFLVRSAAVGIGYFPQASPDLAEGVFKPADLIEKTSRGWKLSGRRTEVINVGGKKVSPHEVERVLLAHPSVREAVVFGARDEARSESVCACVVLGEGGDVATLRTHCARLLAAWQVPRTIIPLAEIPVNSRGKVSRRELAERFGAQ